MIDVEILSPAGDMNSLIAAVENGCDAVYLGGKNFSARQFAGNFDNKEIKKAIEYCHTRGVRVFVTVNTLVKDSELTGVPEYVTYLYNIGADALIIQDMGIGQLIKSVIPEFELHASTQMTAHNLETVNFLYGLGYKRVVLSRELSVDEIKHICENTPAEIEVFAHGALCICYSGQCLMSSMIGGRSGNRGRCAQPCRQKYIINGDRGSNESGFLLSPKDLSTVEHMDVLINSGIKSLKIEGRMKRPEYVGAVTSIYRKAVDNYRKYGMTGITDEDKKNLLKVFNRGGFTTAHLFDKGGREMMSIEKPKNWGVYIGKIIYVNPRNEKVEIQLEDELSRGDGIEIWTQPDNIGYTVESMTVKGNPVDTVAAGYRTVINYKGGKKGDKVYKTSDIKLNKVLEMTYKSSDPQRKIPVRCKMIVERGSEAVLKLQDLEGNGVSVKGPVVEDALRVPLTEERLREQISKLGGTPFSMECVDIRLDRNVSMSVSSINAMRREGLERLVEERIKRPRPHQVSVKEVSSRAQSIISPSKIKSKNEIRVSAMIKDSFKVESAIKGGADIIVFGGDKLRGCDLDYKSVIDNCRKSNVKIYISSPRIVRKEYNTIIKELNEAMDTGAHGIYVENPGILKYAVDNKIPFSCGFSLNTFNLITAMMLTYMGSEFISISPELSLADIRHTSQYIENCEALCYGRIEMMISEYCPLAAVGSKECKNAGGTRLCESKDVSITDRMGMVFPVKTDIYCRSHIYNSRILSMLDSVRDLTDSGVNILRLNFLDEDEDEIFQLVKAYKDSVLYLNGNSGISDGIINVSENIKKKGYTKGHYYRGVD